LGGDVYFLTDKEIYKDYQKRVGKIKDNDPLGHGAIRAYYGIPDGVGIEYEERNFWEYKYPEKIQKCVDNFNVYYSRTFNNLLQNDDLIYLINCAPDKWKENAWKALDLLIAKNPSNYNLLYTVIYAPDKFASKAWALLKDKNSSAYDLRYIIERAPDKFASKAKKILAEREANI
jgi:hypothetical protein